MRKMTRKSNLRTCRNAVSTFNRLGHKGAIECPAYKEQEQKFTSVTQNHQLREDRHASDRTSLRDLGKLLE